MAGHPPLLTLLAHPHFSLFSPACKWQYIPLSLKLLDHHHHTFFSSSYLRTKLNLAPVLRLLLYFGTSLRFTSGGHCRCLSPLVAPVPRTPVSRRRQTWPNAAISPSLLACQLLSHSISISMLDLYCLFLFSKVSPKNVRSPPSTT